MSQAVESIPAGRLVRAEVGESAPAEEGFAGGADDAAEVFCVSRDPRDVGFIKALLASVGGLLVVVILLAVGVAALLMRKPERVVQVRDQQGNVTQIDGFALGGSNGVKVEEDRLDTGDMNFLARELARLMHEVDMTRRRDDLRKVLGAMTKGAADQYTTIVTERGILRTQSAESWNATWKEQDFSVDPRDPANVTIIGTQSVQRTVGGQEVRESVQWSVRFRMAVDPQGRRDENMRSGFIVREFELKPINEPKGR